LDFISGLIKDLEEADFFIPTGRLKRRALGSYWKVKESKKAREVLPTLAEYNQTRLRLRRERSTINGQWRTFKNSARDKKIELTLTLEDWIKMWLDAEPALQEDGSYKPAWMDRDCKRGATRLERRDTSKGYSLENLRIVKKGHVLWELKT
jgi:hypothetical protein